jgi:hypothetical protein
MHALLLASLIGLLASACGSDDDGGEASNQPTTAAPETTTSDVPVTSERSTTTTAADGSDQADESTRSLCRWATEVRNALAPGGHAALDAQRPRSDDRQRKAAVAWRVTVAVGRKVPSS